MPYESLLMLWRLLASRTTRARMESELQELLQSQLAEARADRDYWRARAERLLDNALMRKGEAAGPVMAPHAPPQEKTFGSVFGPLAVTEIESGKRRGRSADGLRGDDGQLPPGPD